MNNIKPYRDISFSDCVDLIAAVGDKTTVLVQGETGTGKSSMRHALSAKMPKHKVFYCDLTTKDTGDIAMPKIRGADGEEVCEFVPNAELGLHSKEPVILLWDELGKAQRGVLNACLRVLLEGKLGQYTLPPGSRQFATTNLADEGLGDVLPAHVRNRITTVTMKKPTASEWTDNFALGNNIHPTIIQSVNQFPQMMGSYRDFATAGENQYVYDPRQPMPAFVTPRSLEKASHILHATEAMKHDLRVHALIGTVGERAAMDIMSVSSLYDKLPKYVDVIDKPSKTPVPTDAGASCLFVYTAIQNVEDNHMAPLMTYINRMRKEAQALFASAIMRSGKAEIAAGDKGFLQWAGANNYLFSA